MRRLVVTLLMLVFGTVALVGCAGTRTNRMTYNPPGFTAPDVVPVAERTSQYRLGVGDTITVRVFGVDSLSGDQQVDYAGNISLPLIGSVPAIGRTTQEVSTDLAHRLGERYLNSPQIQVLLKTVIPQTVTVDGSVSQPGVYPVGMRQTLLQTIALAHGMSGGANPRRVVVFRQIGGQRQAAGFDLTSIRRGTDPDPLIYADDVVVVDGNQTAATLSASLQAIPVIGLFASLVR